MEWQIRQVGFEHSQPLARFAQERLIEPLSRMASGIRGVMVRLKQGDGRPHEGTRGAAVLVKFEGGGTLHIDTWNDCHYSAVSEVADRVRHAVARQLARRRTLRRRRRRDRAA